MSYFDVESCQKLITGHVSFLHVGRTELLLLYFVLLLQAFVESCITRTSQFIGAYNHYIKTYMELYNGLKEKVKKYVIINK